MIGLWAVKKADVAYVESEDIVCLCKDFRCFRKGSSDIFSHACDLGTLIINARDELTVSASAKDLPMHLLPADLARQQSYWSTMRDFITTFMQVIQPLDEPVTAAEEALGLEPGFDKNP